MNDFYFGMGDFKYPVGSIQMIGKSQAPMFRGEKPVETMLAPQFVLEKMADYAVDFWLMTEDLPKPENRVTVDKEGTITLSYTGTNQVPSDMLYAKLKSMLNDLGMHNTLIPKNIYLKNDIGVAGVAHQSGTCAFGRDPKTSVLDANCKAHEVDNLYVVDTSFFPSIGAVNPALHRHRQRHPRRAITCSTGSSRPWRRARKSPPFTRPPSSRGSCSSPSPRSAAS